jgi:hypothetical protein
VSSGSSAFIAERLGGTRALAPSHCFRRKNVLQRNRNPHFGVSLSTIVHMPSNRAQHMRPVGLTSLSEYISLRTAASRQCVAIRRSKVKGRSSAKRTLETGSVFRRSVPGRENHEHTADQGCLASTLAGSMAQMSNTIAPDNALPVSRISQSNASNPKSRWDSEREVMLKCPQYGN